MRAARGPTRHNEFPPKTAACLVAGAVIGEFVKQLMPLLHTCLQPERDQEMRMNVFTMLAKLLLDGGKTLDSRG